MGFCYDAERTPPNGAPCSIWASHPVPAKRRSGWPRHTREERPGTWEHLAARRQHTACRAVTPLLSPSHPSIGRHEIAHAWRGRLGDRGPLMLAPPGTNRSALRLAARPGPGRCTRDARGLLPDGQPPARSPRRRGMRGGCQAWRRRSKAALDLEPEALIHRLGPAGSCRRPSRVTARPVTLAHRAPSR